MQRNFVASVKESPRDDLPDANFYIQLDFHDDSTGLHGNIVTIELQTGTGEETARELVKLLNAHGERVAIRPLRGGG